MQSPGETAPCPKGEYKDGFEAASSCKKVSMQCRQRVACHTLFWHICSSHGQRIKAEAAATDNWLLLLFLSQCANGVTTPDVASTSERACKIVQPSFAPTSVGDGIVKSTQKCPQK